MGLIFLQPTRRMESEPPITSRWWLPITPSLRLPYRSGACTSSWKSKDGYDYVHLKLIAVFNASRIRKLP